MFVLVGDRRGKVHPLQAQIIPTTLHSLVQLTAEVALEVVDEATSVISEVVAVEGDVHWMSVVATCFQHAETEVLRDSVATYLVTAGIQNVEMIDASIAEKMSGDQNGSEIVNWIAREEIKCQRDWKVVRPATMCQVPMLHIRLLLLLRSILSDWPS